MLSRVGTLVIGIIKEKPVNPYEITKLLEMIRLREWFPIAASSVYATIKNLNVKGYIVGEAIREGNMPEKTIYSITEEGRRVFEHTLKEMLGNGGLDSAAFNIGTIMMCHLEKNSVLELLETKLVKNRKELQALKSQYDDFKDVGKVPAYALISLKHNTYLYEAEIKNNLELIEEIRRSLDWSHFLAKIEI